MHDVLNPAEMLADEMTQRREAGYAVDDVEDTVRAALATGAAVEIEQAHVSLEATPLRPDWPYHEPSSLGDIRASLGAVAEVPGLRLNEGELLDRLTGAWLGRCAGCNLGKPVEGWPRAKIRRYLDLADAHPIDDYLPAVESPPEGMQLNSCWPETTRGNIRHMARDDDIDFTILGLHILERHGFGFGPMDVAAEWLNNLPFTQVYTAERAAYRNVVRGLAAPETATHRNPYREWIGAQIRADMWGYVSPGNPEAAAQLAFQDASLSHTQNGIYGEMWVAALIATSFVTNDVRRALQISLAFVPPQSRLAETVHYILDVHASGCDWEQARDAIEECYGHYGFVHTLNNAAVVTAALLWGQGNFSRTIGLAVEGGWDTDCNGATAGSTFGAMHGTAALPDRWVVPLNGQVRSAIIGDHHAMIADLVARTVRLAQTAAGGMNSPIA